MSKSQNNLLLGNGVNQNSNSNELNSVEIKKRFINFLDKNMKTTEHEIIKNAYNKHKDVALLQQLFNHSAPSVTLDYIGVNQDVMDNSMKNFSL